MAEWEVGKWGSGEVRKWGVGCGVWGDGVGEQGEKTDD